MRTRWSMSNLWCNCVIFRDFCGVGIEVDLNASRGNVRGYSLKLGYPSSLLALLHPMRTLLSSSAPVLFVAGSPGAPWYIRAICGRTVLMLEFSFTMGPRSTELMKSLRPESILLEGGKCWRRVGHMHWHFGSCLGKL